MSVKERIIESLKKGPKTLDEIVKEIGAQSRVVKGLLTRLEREGKVEKTSEGKYKLK
ncbi:MAG: hypothetical protein ABWJ42_05710 [Sulfolobales archaeon]